MSVQVEKLCFLKQLCLWWYMYDNYASTSKQWSFSTPEIMSFDVGGLRPSADHFYLYPVSPYGAWSHQAQEQYDYVTCIALHKEGMYVCMYIYTHTYMKNGYLYMYILSVEYLLYSSEYRCDYWKVMQKVEKIPARRYSMLLTQSYYAIYHMMSNCCKECGRMYVAHQWWK